MKIITLFSLFFSMVLAAGCSTVKTVSENSPQATEKSSDYTVITYIHGDSDYLFHNHEGQEIQADNNALQKIHASAQKAENGEYFIFRQQPRKRFLWLFPRRNSQLYHYKNGELVNLISYRNESKSKALFETESEILHELAGQQSGGTDQTYFLYFGHEIPLYPGESYNRSRPNIDVHTESFASGVQRFIPDGSQFDLVALSTCNNGSPAMAHHLQDVSNILLASPQNLHLSHLDTEQLSLLETDPDISSLELADAVAENTYHRLTDAVQTAVTLSVYDMENLTPYINSLYMQTEDFMKQQNPNLYRDNIDCSKVPFFESNEFQGGVRTWFRPAAFGRNAGDSEHSGWGCKGI